ncbi:MAG: phage major capsid protein [Candidatus Acidiferrales bacterium]
MLSNLCILEIGELSHEAEHLAGGTAADRKKADVLLQRITNLRQIGLSSGEIRGKYASALSESLTPKKAVQQAEYRAKFDEYISGVVSDEEFRDFLVGSQNLVYTQGATGGYFVPMDYDGVVREAMSQVDPVLDEDVTSFSMTDGPFLQPEQISGFDLSTISAQLIGESVQQNPQTIPTALGAVLRNNLIFKASFAASMEAEQDIPNFAQKITRAASVALARTIGQHVLTGRGGNADITGIVQALGSPSVSNATSGKLTVTDINSFYFSVNRWYRAAPKAGWLITDGVLKYLRAAADNSGRPLLNVENDREILLGKPIYVSPSLATLYSSIGLTGALIFGDLAHIVIKCSRPAVQRSTQLSQADISRGEALFIGRARADASYFDPSSGVTPPLVLAAIS